MQLHNENNELRTNLTTPAKTFTIHASAKAFKVLSSNMYKYKISAVIRELSCNALDSHVDAGNDEPFVVHLPTAIEPYFAVEDFGTGMAPDQIAELYTTYFASSKTERDDQIGALGLGSKSPFAYTDMFTIDSIKDGVKSTYSAFLSQTGEPTYMAVNSEPSDQHSGVRITFPVPERDFRDFAQDAALIFWAFQRKPIIKGAVKLYNEYAQFDEKIISQGDGWAFYNKYPQVVRNRYSQSYALVRMGNILYPIDGIAGDKQFQDVEMFIRNAIVIDMPLGSCDIAPSREELSYDQLTKDNIHARLLDIQTALISSFSSQIQSQPTAWAAAQEAKKCYGNLAGTYNGKAKYTFNGQDYYYGQTMETDGVTNVACTFERSYRGTRVSIQNSNQPVQNKISMSLGSQSLIVIAGSRELMSSYIRTRVKMYCMEKHPNESVYLRFVNSISKAKLDALGNPPCIKFEDLPKMKHQQGAKSLGNITRVTDGSAVDIADIGDKKKIYVVEYRRKISLNEDYKSEGGWYKQGTQKQRDEFKALLRAVFNDNLLPKTILSKIYIVPAKLFDSLNLSKKKGWVSLESIIVTGASYKFKKNVGIYNNASNLQSLMNYYDPFYSYLPQFQAAQFHEKSPMADAILFLLQTKNGKNDARKVDEATKVISAIQNLNGKLYQSVREAVGGSLAVKDSDSDVEDPCKIFEHYPLLNKLFSNEASWNRTNYRELSFRCSAKDGRGLPNASKDRVAAIEDIISYVKMVDKINGLD